MSSRVRFHLLLITDGFDERTAARVEAALTALPAGAAALQLRAKALGGHALWRAAARLQALAHEHGATLLVNDRADVARAVGAGGVHLPARGLPPATARQLLGDDALIGVSTHSAAEVSAAISGGADYVTFGPVFATPNKGAPVGLSGLAAAVRASALPLCALGGIDAARAADVVAAGARVACIGAVLGQPDVAAAAQAMWSAIANGAARALSAAVAPELVAELQRLEERLLEPVVRGSQAALEALLDQQFREIGSSGRWFDRHAVIAALATETGAATVTLSDLQAQALAPGVVLLTYRATSPTRSSLRSSIWRQTPAGWRLVFNQGTPSAK